MTTINEHPTDNEQRCCRCRHWTIILGSWDYPEPGDEGQCTEKSSLYGYTARNGWCPKWKEAGRWK